MKRSLGPTISWYDSSFFSCSFFAYFIGKLSRNFKLAKFLLQKSSFVTNHIFRLNSEWAKYMQIGLFEHPIFAEQIQSNRNLFKYTAKLFGWTQYEQHINIMRTITRKKKIKGKWKRRNQGWVPVVIHFEVRKKVVDCRA